MHVAKTERVVAALGSTDASNSEAAVLVCAYSMRSTRSFGVRAVVICGP